jgi:hypothetical protein
MVLCFVVEFGPRMLQEEFQLGAEMADGGGDELVSGCHGLLSIQPAPAGCKEGLGSRRK